MTNIGYYYCSKYFKSIPNSMWKKIPLKTQGKIKAKYDEYKGNKCGIL